jgi:hypothetical protein
MVPFLKLKINENFKINKNILYSKFHWWTLGCGQCYKNFAAVSYAFL